MSVFAVAEFFVFVTVGFDVVAFAAAPVDLTVGSVPTALFAVAVAVAVVDPCLVGEDACAWSLAYVV